MKIILYYFPLNTKEKKNITLFGDGNNWLECAIYFLYKKMNSYLVSLIKQL